MSIISQIGVVILIAFIVLVLIRSNKNLKKASEEGENFVDEWALRQEKKEEIKQKREEKKLEVQKEKEQKKLQKKQKRKEILVDEDNEPEEYELREEKEEKQALEAEQYAEEYPKKNDFSEMEPIYLEPSNSIRWQKKVVILTNRRCYSATNDFVNVMRSLNNDNEDKRIIQLGDQTGGGSGLPFSSELPNGWSVRFSASPHFDKYGKSLEDGIKPDVYVNMDKILEEGIEQGDIESQKKDPLIEKAFEILSE